MKMNTTLLMSLSALALLAGCSSMPQNAMLSDAHSHYDNARTDPQITRYAAVELKQAGDTLNKADQALKNDEKDATVNQLAYIADQQINIAQQTASQKAAEAAIADASAMRTKAQLDARTAEAEAAKQKMTQVQQTAEQQAAALAAAQAKSESDQALIASQEAQLKALNAKKTDRGMVITLNDVLFAVNKAELTPGGMRNVQKLADYLKQDSKIKVLVEGYTDSTGSDSYNLELSERRADSVRSALVGMGIAEDRIAKQGYGKAYPVASNSNASGRQLNRRVEIILSDENGNIQPR